VARHVDHRGHADDAAERKPSVPRVVAAAAAAKAEGTAAKAAAKALLFVVRLVQKRATRRCC
jgi:hypothetical protein